MKEGVLHLGSGGSPIVILKYLFTPFLDNSEIISSNVKNVCHFVEKRYI